MKSQNEQTAPTNPIIQAIPEGAKVTVLMENGTSFTGTDDTTHADAEQGLFVLFASANDLEVLRNGGKANRKTYLLASNVVGFEMFYDHEGTQV